ncbi:unnamed protein product [Schistosoma mattheei]|uniref:Uncharacterized protein n=1 Tax=Schistosoma mattheei TaxID=31246 RepID=A0A183NI91_9TREM|nr:unnamed protein product [Schistosoma mattheei]
MNRPASMNSPNIKAAQIDFPIDVISPTIEEIRMTIKQIKSGKEAGPENMSPEKLEFRSNYKQAPHSIQGGLSKCEEYSGITQL